MGLVTALFLCMLLLQDSKGPSVSAEYDQSCHISPQLEEECSVYAHQVTKPMLRYFEQVSQKIDKHSEEIESKNEQIKHLQEKETSLEIELDDRNEQIRQQGENIMKLQLENMNYKLKETAVFNDLKEKIEQLPNLCEYQNRELKELKAKEVQLQRELQSKNEQIRLLGENMIKLQRQNTNYKSKEDSMAAVQEELRKQQVIIEQLPKTICEKENTEIRQINRKLSSIDEKLIKNERQLTSEKETTFGKYQQINQLGMQVKESADRHGKKNAASCIDRDSSGVQTVTLSRGVPRTFQILCNSNIAGPGWTVIQQRIRGGVDFYRDWNTYRNGFGEFWNGDFFLGLDKIHRLTAEQPCELYIHMESFDGRTYFAKYDEFAISGADDQYILSKLGRFSGITTDKLRRHENMRFTTYDRDNDKDKSVNCAPQRHGGWWYNNCADSNLNGKYYQTEAREFNGIYWEGFLPLKQVKMMIRPKAA